MNSDKPALKRQRDIQKAPEKLVLQEKFEFFVPLPMQECIVRLKMETQEEVYLARISPTKIEFNIVQRGRKASPMWAVGYIEELDASRTRIFGKTGIPQYELFITIGVLLLIGFIVTVSNLSSLWSVCLGVLLFAPLVIPLVFMGNTWGREALMDKINTIRST